MKFDYNPDLYTRFREWLKFLGVDIQQVYEAREEFIKKYGREPHVLVIPSDLKMLGMKIELSDKEESVVLK